MSCDVEDTCVCLQPCGEQRMCRTCPHCTPMDPDLDENYDENESEVDYDPEDGPFA